MIISKRILHSELGQPNFTFLSSDQHLGSANSDHSAIVRQFAEAEAVGADILLNGDLFDGIGPKDRRFDLSTLHPSLRGKKDLAAAIVSMALELLMPFRKNIKWIGMGNHEDTWITYGYNDPIRRVIEELNREGGAVKHASFQGYIVTSFVVPGYRKRPKHKLYYLHGTGGDSPVTKGTIDFNRKGRNFSYDCLTFGHKHNLVCAADQIADVSDSGKYLEKKQLNLQTGSYYKNYTQLSDESVLDQSYAARSGHPPKPQGGVFLITKPGLDRVTGDLVVEQDFASAIIAPWTAAKVRKAKDLRNPEKEQDQKHIEAMSFKTDRD